MSRRSRESSARHILVSGRVQGVGFRWSAQAAAQRLGIAGWVRNLPDGSVEVHAQGAPAAVEAMVAWLGRGPAGAEICRVDEEPAAVEPALEGFVIRR
jgi:acylphosphatase